MRIDGPDADADRPRLLRHGWRLTDPTLFKTLKDYPRYIGRSRAEFSVAHNRYVAFQTGWFSDRSALYLASGKPALVQSTGIEAHLPTGRGLLTFETLDDAIAGLEEISRNYAAHCRAARDIAETYFGLDYVLDHMVGVLEC